ncbi:hypothetical protein J1N35_019581 [Gossypium stocksii]|uniref:RNase H type-1 domain-containing protein n=1 Tax=Gossypium stocksii TaxID=47602 RepID=A0A9D3VR55_9ROSI|nr:hypothetical protein J1N35_019581 [Gossypium stocksii]
MIQSQAVMLKNLKNHIFCIVPMLVTIAPNTTTSSKKVNFDVSFISHYCKIGACIVLRDFEGFVVGATTLKLSNVTHSAIAEALATVKAIEIAMEMGHSLIFLESDR